MWRVMIADDEITIRKGLSKLIPWEKLDCELVFMAKNGRELMDNLDTYQPNIVIVDIQMPIMNGLEVAKVISENYPHIAVIILTAYSDFKYAKKAIKCNVVDYIVKTSAIEDLPDAVKRATDRLSSQLTEEDPISERVYIRALVDGSYYFDPEALEYKGLHEKYKVLLENFRLLIVHCVDESIHGQNNEWAGGVLKFVDMALSEYSSITFPVSKTEVCILLISNQSPVKEIIDCCNRINEFNYSFLGLRTVIGISDSHCGIENLNQAYLQADSLILHNFMDGHRDVFVPQEKGKANVQGELTELVEELFIDISNMKTQEANKKLKRVMLLCQDMEMIHAKSSAVILVSGCRRMCRQINHDLDKEFFNKEGAIDTAIFGCKKISSLENLLAEMINFVINLLYEESGKTQYLIVQVEKYIEQNYCNKITLSDVANAVYTNPSYLSRLYKEKTGNNMFDVINRKKIEKAKQYIEGTSMKSYEIANAIGIDDTGYFSKFFKKNTGLSPTDYEKEIRGKETVK
jgi:two-component system response regulator YesN